MVENEANSAPTAPDPAGIPSWLPDRRSRIGMWPRIGALVLGLVVAAGAAMYVLGGSGNGGLAGDAVTTLVARDPSATNSGAHSSAPTALEHSSAGPTLTPTLITSSAPIVDVSPSPADSGTVLTFTDGMTWQVVNSGTNLLWHIIGFRNTSETTAAVFTPEYQIQVSTGGVITPPVGPVFLFPGESYAPRFEVQSGTVVTSASAEIGNITWLAPQSPGALATPPAPGASGSGPVGWQGLSYTSFADACKFDKTTARFGGCTYDNASPFPIRVVGAADMCVSVGDRTYNTSEIVASSEADAVVIPANGSLFVPTPADVEDQAASIAASGNYCLNPDYVITMDQPAFPR